MRSASPLLCRRACAPRQAASAGLRAEAGLDETRGCQSWECQEHVQWWWLCFVSQTLKYPIAMFATHAPAFARLLDPCSTFRNLTWGMGSRHCNTTAAGLVDSACKALCKRQDQANSHGGMDRHEMQCTTVIILASEFAAVISGCYQLPGVTGDHT